MFLFVKAYFQGRFLLGIFLGQRVTRIFKISILEIPLRRQRMLKKNRVAQIIILRRKLAIHTDRVIATICLDCLSSREHWTGKMKGHVRKEDWGAWFSQWIESFDVLVFDEAEKTFGHEIWSGYKYYYGDFAEANGTNLSPAAQDPGVENLGSTLDLCEEKGPATSSVRNPPPTCSFSYYTM